MGKRQESQITSFKIVILIGILMISMTVMDINMMDVKAQSNSVELEAKNNVEVNKTWTITFSKALDLNSVNNTLVYIENMDGEKLPHEYSLSGDNVLLLSPLTPYEYESSYKLHIKKGLKSSDGTIKTNRDYLMVFTTESLESSHGGRYKLNESSQEMGIWTDYPSEKIFKDDLIPTESDSGISVYMAKNEFEPFQLVLNPLTNQNIKVSLDGLPQGMTIQMHQVDYVYLEDGTDALSHTGWYPDPLYPIEFEQELQIEANENTPLWFTLHTSETILPGDYTISLSFLDTVIPVKVHVYDFMVPKDLHIKSQINISYQSILDKYGVSGTGEEYWKYVDLIKQFMIDHRLTPKSVLWSGGLTSMGGAPYIDYNSSSSDFHDPHGIWGFEYPASRYLDGFSNSQNQYLDEAAFNGGIGFPSFMAMTFMTNDSSADQRPLVFQTIRRSQSDWYLSKDLNSEYNTAWFKYIRDLSDYLRDSDYLDKAYYYMANEPQDKADYDAVSWYSQALKTYAPDLKLMVSEEPKEEIYNNPDYPGAKIDIWLPVLNKYNPEVSWEREASHNEETWIYFLHGTKPPYFNPITLDHPGIESKLTGWFLWKNRIKGIAHYSFNNWQRNVWEDTMTSNHNGDNFMLYPPSKTNTSITYGETNHRLVTSIRFELMRDSLEDYEYLYVLNNMNQPEVYKDTISDTQVDKIIYGLTSYNRDSHVLYQLRKNIGRLIDSEIASIPDTSPRVTHDRAVEEKASYYINFQDPNGLPNSIPLNVEGKTYQKIGWNAYDTGLGYGWFGDLTHVKYHYNSSETNALKASILYDDWGREKVFEYDLPNGDYKVTVSCGWQGRTYNRNRILIEGVTFIDDEATSPYLIRTKEVSVKDNKLTMEMGIFDEYTMLNYLEIEPLD